MPSKIIKILNLYPNSQITFFSNSKFFSFVNSIFFQFKIIQHLSREEKKQSLLIFIADLFFIIYFKLKINYFWPHRQNQISLTMETLTYNHWPINNINNPSDVEMQWCWFWPWWEHGFLSWCVIRGNLYGCVCWCHVWIFLKD